MSVEKISFSDNRNAISAFFLAQNITLPESFSDELLRFLSTACIYEEEETKIRPSIIIGSNLLSENVIRLIQATVIPFVEEPLEETHLVKRLKSSLPFCNNGWRVFINLDETKVTYGIIRNFNGPSGLRIDDILSSLSSEDREDCDINFVLIDVISNFVIELKNNDSKCVIDFRLIEDAGNSDVQKRFCDDLLSAYDGDIQKVSTAYKKTIALFSQKLHGSICVIVKHDCVLPDEVLKDGVFLQSPIDIYPIIAEDLNDKNQNQDISFTISSHEKYHAFTGLLLEMLNIDGVTVVDNKGRIRAFNVFVKPDTANTNAVSGGARKRAAHYLWQQTNPNYIGVYFQSQDGMSSYERTGIL